MKAGFSKGFKCAKCKTSPTTLHSKICGDCAYAVASERKCQICQASPTIAFASGFTSNFCREHVLKALEDALSRKARLVGVVKNTQEDLSRAKDNADYYKKRYYDLREEIEDKKFEGARKRMKASLSEMTEKEIQEITDALYS